MLLVMVRLRVEVAPTAMLPKGMVVLLSVATCADAAPTQNVQETIPNRIALDQFVMASYPFLSANGCRVRGALRPAIR